MFKNLSKDSVEQNEERLLKYWKDINILDLSINKESPKGNFVFYDGPATANAMPGLHHVVPKANKDIICKYKTMQGYRVLRKVGWDTHGLPVENQVEKELGLKDKKDIEKYGIESFNQKCRESVWENEEAFTNLTNKMGQFIDTDHPYVTYDNNYIETEWWILKKFFDAGMLYEGHKITTYCPRCGTSLSSHEVAQGYQDISVDTVIVPFKKKDEDVYFLVWTTTPWTLIANVALCVNPNEDYVLVESQGYKFIVAKALATKVLGEEYQVLETFKGSHLEYTEYEQLIPSLTPNKKAFYVTCDTYVTMEDGTGIVHMAPAFGEDDSNVGKRYDLPVLNPVGPDGKYTEGLWKGTLVFDADLEVIKYLKENDKLFKKQKMVHSYPHCWRCHSPLLYYPFPTWYIRVTDLKDQLIANNNKVNWYPSYVGEKRFGNWLENVKDWGLSRKRYWGTPLNIWKCECGHIESIGSRKELVEKSVEDIKEDIELHKPFVDNIHLKCPDCGKEMTRVEDVIDCWFDSGSMPYAQYHYPFENQELFNEQFPADFISEGIDQTRGWFYTLLVISTFVSGQSCFKNVLVNDMLLDKNGFKMSKSKGNIVRPFETIKTYGADTLRFYLQYASPTWTPTIFDEDGLKEISSKFIGTLKNTYNFFSLYANTDKVDPREFNVDYQDLEEIDKWLLSKYNNLVKNVNDSFNIYDINKVARMINTFVNDDLSNWYIRRNRKRFWGSELDLSKKSVYQTTYQVLLGLVKLLAPIMPFITEEMYQVLTDKTSVHLENYPVCDDKLINEQLENKMDLVRDLISLGRNARETSKIKVRQPIKEIILDGKVKSVIGQLSELIKEELNVKELVFENDLSKYMNFKVKPNFKLAGPVFGNKIKDFTNFLNSLTEQEMVDLKNGNPLSFNDVKVTSDLIEVIIESKEGFDVVMEDNKFIILDTTLTPELIKEGVARELVSKIQNIRKQKDYDVADRINILYNGDINDILDEFSDYIKNETLSINFIKKNSLDTEYQLNDIKAYLDTERI